MIMLGLCYLTLAAAISGLHLSRRRFDTQRDSVPYRIHVHGSQGTSTVTRYITAILREHGLRTFGKTAGAAARVIMPTGEDAALKRRHALVLSEQLRLVRSFAARKAQAVVVESTVTHPRHQAWLERRVMHSQIMIITNVRQTPDKTPAEHARDLAAAIPHNALVITADRQPEVLALLQTACDSKSTQLIRAAARDVRDTDLQAFGPDADKENVAIGLAAAELFSIDRATALTAMTHAINAQAAPTDTDAANAGLPTYNPSQKVRGRLHRIIDKLDVSHDHPAPMPAKLTKRPRNA